MSEQLKIDSNTQTPPTKSFVETLPREMDWIKKLRTNEIGVLVVGHGTRNPDGKQQLIGLTEEIRSLLPGVAVEPSFLELCEPDITHGLSKLKERGCSELFVVPILLFTAAHAQEDIPDAVAKGCAELGLKVLGQTVSLGTHPMVVELSRLRFKQVLTPRDYCEPGHCSWGADPNYRCQAEGRDDCCRLGFWHESRRLRALELGKSEERIGLAMVGRGTSDPTARGHMQELTRKRVELTPVMWSQTGFFAGGEVDVDQLLEEAALADCGVIVVQPHLLFEGELMNKLRQKLGGMRSRFPEKTWWLAGCLGADPSLADVFVGLLGEQVVPFLGLAKSGDSF
ncbi:MAG: sirohydrochlorin chelatase [Pirellula sp.]|jgi:sirohydrochlorin cobaltochelatase